MVHCDWQNPIWPTRISISIQKFMTKAIAPLMFLMVMNPPKHSKGTKERQKANAKSRKDDPKGQPMSSDRSILLLVVVERKWWR